MFGWPQIPKPADPPTDDPPQLDLEDALVMHRFRRLCEEGFPAIEAMEIANTRIDYYRAIELLKQGCPADRVLDLLI